MKTTTIAWIVLGIIIIVGGGWYYYAHYYGGEEMSEIGPIGQTQTNQNPNGPDYSPNGTPGATASATVLQASTNAALGSFLSSPVTGKTLYTYANDAAGVSNCSGQCAVNWPPYLVEPGITLLGASGVGGKLGTIIRADGGTQLTYNGAPLYTYIKDTKPGDTVGQGVGGVWYVVKP